MKLLEQIIQAGLKDTNKIAFAEKTRHYTYRDLFEAMAHVADKIAVSADSDRPILIFGRNDFLTLASMLAVNLTGRAYIPVDAHTPFERTQMIYSVSKPSLIIATVPLEDEFDRLFAYRVDFTDFVSKGSFDSSSISCSQAVSGIDTTYIIYTSGTTGLPKGVAVSHDNLQSFARWMAEDFVIIPDNQILCQPPFSFDLSVFSIFPSLITGGTLVSVSREETINFKLLFERLNTTTINTWISTPSFADICLLDPSFTQDKHPQLQQFIFCGEELTHKTAEKLLTAFPDATIWNTYGPTEATGAISSIKVTPELLSTYSRVPIGFAKPGVTLQIIDREIIITGDSVAKGYFENSEKTAQAFFKLEGKPAYHTGDAGFFDEDHVLNYNGRIDFQVKFNGYRIELQDIEAHLLEIDAIQKAVVLPQENEEHKVTGLIAVLQSPVTFSDKKAEREFTKTLKAVLGKTIMDYMMPTKFVYLNEFPLNQNAKIDRKALETAVGVN